MKGIKSKIKYKRIEQKKTIKEIENIKQHKTSLKLKLKTISWSFKK